MAKLHHCYLSLELLLFTRAQMMIIISQLLSELVVTAVLADLPFFTFINSNSNWFEFE